MLHSLSHLAGLASALNLKLEFPALMVCWQVAKITLPTQAYNAEKAGAKAIIVTDYKDERLLTMAVPEDRPEIAALKNDITIPTALITQEVRLTTDILSLLSP